MSKSYDYHYTYSWEVTEQLGTDIYHVSDALVGDATYDAVFYGEEARYMHLWEGQQLTGDTSTFPSAYTTEVTRVFERSTDLTQKFGVVYTWCRKDGDVIECESNPSPVAYVQNEGGISVTIPATAGDSQVTHARIYRTLGDGAERQAVQ